jgi:hypothetical protein
MEAQAFTSLPSLKDVAEHILSSRRITRRDQRLLLALTASSSEELNLISQVFDRLRRGLLKVVD